jgi:hypothetical protein
MASQKQLAANRRNALKSTGPRTATGKAKSRLNAIQHGVLCESVVVDGHFYWEDPLEFASLHNELAQNLRPVGRVEELLVERMATCAWRIRRVLKAENGEIRLSTDTGTWARLKRRQRVGETLARHGHADGGWCSVSVRYHVDAMKRLRERVRADGRLTQDALCEFSVAFENRETELLNRLRQFYAATTNSANRPSESDGTSQPGEDVLAYLDEKIAGFEAVVQDMAEEESRDDMARLDAAVLPSAEVIEKLQRYETSLERQYYRAMNQLERLQRRRAGEHIPAPVSMDIGAP